MTISEIRRGDIRFRLSHHHPRTCGGNFIYLNFALAAGVAHLVFGRRLFPKIPG